MEILISFIGLTYVLIAIVRTIEFSLAILEKNDA